MRRAAAAAVGAGGAALAFHPGPPSLAAWLLVAAVVLAGLVVLGARRGEAVLVVALAALAVTVRLAVAPWTLAVERAVPEGTGPWQAVVESLTPPREGQQPATIVLSSEGLRVAATLPRFPAIVPGDRITVDGSIRPPPDGSYGDYLRRIGVIGTLRSRTLLVDESAPGRSPLEDLRRGAVEALARAIPEPEAGLAAGILIGVRDRIDRQLAADFTTAGASHVVAISGWNIAIVAASIAALGGTLGRRRRSVLTALAILGYVVFVGASPSVVRAAAMAGVVLLARESGRAGRAAAALGWAASLLLLAEPGLIRDAGFQLSTVATAGLLVWATPLSGRLGRLAGGRLPGWLTEGLGVSLAAQAATLPIVLASFGRLSLVAPVVNIGVVPLVAPAMAAGGIALVAGAVAAIPGVPAMLATFGGLPAWGLLTMIVAIVRWFAGLPLASVTFAPPAGAIAGAAMAGLIALFGTSRGRRLLRLGANGGPRTPSPPATPKPAPRTPAVPRSALVGLAALVALAGLAWVKRPDGTTRIVVLDVGQGDAILVEGSRGSRMLIDGGPDPDRLLVALDERLPPWDRELDALLLTHPHEDHVAGLALLLERYRVGRVLEPGMRGAGPGYRAWLAGLASTGVPNGILATGDRLTVDDARLRVLWPDPGTVPSEPADSGTGVNNVSVVLLGEVDGRRFLLSGDIEEEIDPTLLARGLPAVDVLKVAHHGSATATTDAFLDAVQPRVAVVSAGADNPYGHPNPGTLGRLEERGARVFRTDRDGDVDVAIADGRVSVRTAGATTSRRVAAATAPQPLAPRFRCAVALPADDVAAAPGPPRAPLYHRPDDGPRAQARRPPPAEPRSPALVSAALAGGGRGRGLARGADRRARDAGRPSAGRGGCPPARRRQAAARHRPRPPPGPRRRLRRLAHPAGTRGARTSCRKPSRDPPWRRRPLPDVGGIRQPGGADRGLR